VRLNETSAQVLMKWKEPLAFSQVRHPFVPKRNYWPIIIFFFLLQIAIIVFWRYRSLF